MAAPVENSPAALCAEILAEARRESGEILHRAKAEAEKILADANAEAEKILRERREQTQAEAARRKELILATVAVEAGRLRAARVEALLESVRDEIRRRLLAREFDARETLVTLAAKAICQIAGNDFVLKISAADHAAFGDGLAQEISQRAGRSPLNITISTDATVTDGGVIIQTADRFQVWDNRLSSRLERLWPELRRQIAIRASLAGQNEEPLNFSGNIHEARQRLGVRQSSGAFTPPSKAAENCRSPKPGGSSNAPMKEGA